MPWDAMGQVIIASMNKGQAPLILVFLIVMTYMILVKDSLPKPVDLAKGMAQFGIVGYVLWVLTGLGWFYHHKWVRKKHSAECERIGKEKSRLQSKLNKKQFKSSDKS